LVFPLKIKDSCALLLKSFEFSLLLSALSRSRQRRERSGGSTTGETPGPEFDIWKGDRRMAKAATASRAMTKSQVAASLAESTGISKKQSVAYLQAVADLAYKQAKNSFTIPGIGKLVLVNRKARMGRNPATGAVIQIPAKKVVKFRVAKAAKDALLGAKK
jgi:DNA-binding protein HU-beta